MSAYQGGARTAYYLEVNFNAAEHDDDDIAARIGWVADESGTAMDTNTRTLGWYFPNQAALDNARLHIAGHHPGIAIRVQIERMT
jgi:hypothetical protein